MITVLVKASYGALEDGINHTATISGSLSLDLHICAAGQLLNRLSFFSDADTCSYMNELSIISCGSLGPLHM